MSDRLLRVDQVAEMLGVGRRTVYDWTRQELLPVVVLRPGERKTMRWRESDIDRWIRQRTIPGRSQAKG